MSRRCHLPRDLRNAQQVNWDWIKDGNAVAEPGISSVPVVVGLVSLCLKIADPYARFKPDSLGSLSNCGFRERFIDFTCHPELVQQYRQLSRYRHDRPLLGFLFPARLDPQSKLLQRCVRPFLAQDSLRALHQQTS
jgi:hypothetical protein